VDTELSFEQVVGAYTATVYGVALTHTAHRADADDVFQEVFAAYWKSRPVFNSEEHRKAWLIRTTLNQSLKVTQSSWAKRTVYDEAVVDVADHGPRQEDFPFQTEQQRALYAAMRSLAPAYRTVVLLFYFEDLSIAQIAELLQEEQGTVKTRLSRARAHLRSKLEEEGAGDD